MFQFRVLELVSALFIHFATIHSPKNVVSWPQDRMLMDKLSMRKFVIQYSILGCLVTFLGECRTQLVDARFTWDKLGRITEGQV